MHYEHDFETDRGFVMVRAWGTATAEGFEALDRELIEHPQWRAGRSVLFDLRELDMTELSSPGTRTSAAFVTSISEALGDGRWACVMGRDVDYGLARMFQALTDGTELEVMVFREIEEALAWLGSPEGGR